LAESLPLALHLIHVLHATIQPYEAREGVSKRPDRTDPPLHSNQTKTAPFPKKTAGFPADRNP